MPTKSITKLANQLKADYYANGTGGSVWRSAARFIQEKYVSKEEFRKYAGHNWRVCGRTCGCGLDEILSRLDAGRG